MNVVKLSKINNLNLFSIVIASAIGIINSFFYNNQSVMLVLTVIEVTVLLITMLLKKNVQFLCLYLMFLSLSIEFEAFTTSGVVYGFKGFRIAGINVALWCLLVFFIFNLGVNKKIKISKSRKTISFIKMLLGIVVVGIVMGGITILINDNAIRQATDYIGVYIDECYIYLFVLLEVITFSQIVSSNIDKLYVFKQYLIAIIIAMAVVCVCCVGFHNYGYYGGVNTLLISNLNMLVVLSVILVFYKGYTLFEKIVIGSASSVLLLLILMSNANAKNVILVAFVPIIAIYLLIQSGMNLKKIVGIIAIVGGVIFFVLVVFPTMISNSVILASKFNSALSMLRIWKSDWLENMNHSPRIRIAELLNIAHEYYIKPWYVVFGKGFGGTITDSLNIFGFVTNDDFSSWQRQHQIFVDMHGAFNALFLSSGVVGICFFVKVIVLCIKDIHKSPWILFGLIWFALYLNYSLTISVFGVLSIIIGFYEIDTEKESF